MGKFIEWVTSKFQHPLSLLFFLLGSLLLLLGITTGLEVPLLKQLTPDVHYRWVSLALGWGFVLLAIAVYYVPPKPVTVVRPG